MFGGIAACLPSKQRECANADRHRRRRRSAAAMRIVEIVVDVRPFACCAPLSLLTPRTGLQVVRRPYRHLRVVSCVNTPYNFNRARADAFLRDESFNSITGLNGSGKSNILDSICFVLGITNMTTVRAQNLQVRLAGGHAMEKWEEANTGGNVGSYLQARSSGRHQSFCHHCLR